jgi:O-antigen ligase
MVILLLISFCGILFFAYTFPDTTQRAYFSSIEKIFNWRTSDYGLVWQSAYDVWMQSPLFGVGLHKYREACENLGIYGSSYLTSIGAGVCFHPHNISLQLLSETGIIGFILFYIMVCVLTFSSLKTFYIKKLWLSFALVFNIIFTCFLPIASSTSFFANKYAAIIWLLIGVMLATNSFFQKSLNNLFLFKIFIITSKTLSAVRSAKLSTFKISNFPLLSSDLIAEVEDPNRARPFLFKHEAIWDGPESFQ